MNTTITFIFDNHQVDIAGELAAALLEDALFSLLIHARLTPNRNERGIIRDWLVDCRIDDPGRNMTAPAPVITIDEKVNDVYEALYNRAVGKYKAGGFPCYAQEEKRWRWAFDPTFIAMEMNNSHMFDFHVSPVHVEQAQARLRAGQ